MSTIPKPQSMIIAEKEVAIEFIMSKLHCNNMTSLKRICQQLIEDIDFIEEYKIKQNQH